MGVCIWQSPRKVEIKDWREPKAQPRQTLSHTHAHTGTNTHSNARTQAHMHTGVRASAAYFGQGKAPGQAKADTRERPVQMRPASLHNTSNSIRSECTNNVAICKQTEVRWAIVYQSILRSIH